jgi:hypothetical protein
MANQASGRGIIWNSGTLERGRKRAGNRFSLRAFYIYSQSNIAKEVKVAGTTRRVVRERRLSAAYVEPDGPACPSVPPERQRL